MRDALIRAGRRPRAARARRRRRQGARRRAPQRPGRGRELGRRAPRGRTRRRSPPDVSLQIALARIADLAGASARRPLRRRPLRRDGHLHRRAAVGDRRQHASPRWPPPRPPARRPGRRSSTPSAPRSASGRAAARLQRLAAHLPVPPGHGRLRASGPWCAYFVSWAARQAGVPLGDSGQGFGRVDDVMAWAQQLRQGAPRRLDPARPAT